MLPLITSERIGSDAPEPSQHPAIEGAPWHSVPSRTIVCVEHPFIVERLSRVISSLGGPQALEKLVRPKGSGEQNISLLLHPEDRMSRPVLSGNLITSNVLIEIRVPKRTGRKRKRGSPENYRFHHKVEHAVRSAEAFHQDPLHERAPEPNTIRNLLRCLGDANGKYHVQPVGTIEQTHRFRSMPDFAWSMSNDGFMQKIRKNILPFDYDHVKGFTLDMSRHSTGTTSIMPPLKFTHLNHPFNYSYKQNPSVKQLVDDSGKVKTVNTGIALKIHKMRIGFDAASIPIGPADGNPPLSTLDPLLQGLVARMKCCMLERPIWTSRALENQFTVKEGIKFVKLLYQYVGYMFASGPWRGAIIRFGVDPRADPQYRLYQTLLFQYHTEQVHDTDTKEPEQKKPGYRTMWTNRTSHIFDGLTVPAEGKSFQVCDITDPLIKGILATTNLREKCHIKTHGWYYNGTYAKAKVILKAKIDCIVRGNGPPRDVNYMKIVALPDIISRNTRASALLSRHSATSQEIEWATTVRAYARLEDEGEGEDEGLSEPTDLRVDISMREYDERLRQEEEEDRILYDEPETGSSSAAEPEDEEDESRDGEEGEEDEEEEEG